MQPANFRKVQHKLLAGVLLSSLAGLFVTAVVLLVYDLRSYESMRVSDWTTQAEIIGRASAPALQFEDQKFADTNLALLRARPEVEAAALYNAKGALFSMYVRDGLSGNNLATLPEIDGARVDGNALHVYKRVVDNGEILGTIYIRAHYGFYERLWSYLAILLGVGALSLLVSLAASSWLQRHITRPILDVTGVARRVVEYRDFSLRAVKTTQDEIAFLVQAFNDVLAEIQRQTEALEATNNALGVQIDDRRRAEEEVRRLNADLEVRVERRTAELEATNRELESFSYSVSHDLRAPLRAIDGYSRMVQEDYQEKLDEDGQRMLSVVREEAVKMGRLIDDLLSFSKLSRKAMETSAGVDMTALAKETANSLLRDQNAERVKLDIWPLPTVPGDAALLRQVWVNLLSNALKYSSSKPKAEILVTGEQVDGQAHFRVQDNGVGFDMKYAPKLFGVFQRLHKAEEFEGTGVGLAIVQRVILRHGGNIRADARPGEGATFHFTLPARAQND